MSRVPNSAHAISDSIVNTKFIGQSSNSTQMSLTSVSLIDKVGTTFSYFALGVQSLSSRLLAVRDPNSHSFTLFDDPRQCGPGHQQVP